MSQGKQLYYTTRGLVWFFIFGLLIYISWPKDAPKSPITNSNYVDTLLKEHHNIDSMGVGQKGNDSTLTFINRGHLLVDTIAIFHSPIGRPPKITRWGKDGFWFWIRDQLAWEDGGGDIMGKVIDHVPDDSIRKWIGKKVFDSLYNDYQSPSR